jgi:plastocyanin
MFNKKLITFALVLMLIPTGWIAYQTSIANVTPAAVNVTVTARDFSYTPSTITVSAGQKVHLTFKNEGKVVHEIIFEGFDAGTKAEAGETNGANFTAPRAGTYTFVCTIPGHKEAGMVGQLIVQ